MRYEVGRRESVGFEGLRCSDPLLAPLVDCSCRAAVVGASDSAMRAGALRVELEVQVGVWTHGDRVATRRKVPPAIGFIAVRHTASTGPTDSEVGRVAVDFERRVLFADPPPGNKRGLQHEATNRLLIYSLSRGIVLLVRSEERRVGKE